MSHTISIITTLYKGKRYIDNLLKMVDKASKAVSRDYGVEVEYIMVNDYPEEKIDVSIYSFKSFDFVIITNDRNKGIHESRAIGINNAKGEYILILDQDDRISNTYLSSQYNYINNYDVVVSNGYLERDSIIQPIYTKQYEIEQLSSSRYWGYLGSFIISPGQCLIRKDVVPKYWLNNHLKSNCSDDYLLWLLLLSKGKVFCFNNDLIYTHCDNGGNISYTWANVYDSNLEICTFKDIEKELPATLVDQIKRTSTVKKEWKQHHRVLNWFDNMDVIILNIVYRVYKRFSKRIA